MSKARSKVNKTIKPRGKKKNLLEVFGERVLKQDTPLVRDEEKFEETSESEYEEEKKRTVCDIINFFKDDIKITHDQCQQLAKFKYQENGQKILSTDDMEVVIEILGMLKTNGYKFVKEFLEDANNRSFVLWDQPFMVNNGLIAVKREILIQQSDEEGVSNVAKCRYCPSKDLIFATKQLRSGDEPATIFVRCTQCKKGWKE